MAPWEIRAAERQREREARIAELKARGIECVDCEDTGKKPNGYPCHCEAGAEGRAEQERRRQVEIEQAHAMWTVQMLGGVNIPARYGDYTLDTYPNQQSSAYQSVRAWLDSERPRLKPGLFLSGGFGVGKTGLVVGILRELAELHRPDDPRYGAQRFSEIGWFTTTTALLESLRPNDDVREDWMRRYQRARHLVIDDIGAERLTEWGVDRLFEIVNHRHNELQAMLVTSNLSPDELARRINKQIGDRSGDRIVERLVESCTVIRFDEREPNLRMRGAA